MAADDNQSSKDHGSPNIGEDQGGKPLSEILPTSGIADLLKRLAGRRSAEPRHSRGETIAQGGMGEILRVRDQDLGRDLAMKIVRREYTDLDGDAQARLLARFLEEAQVTGQLHHPSIVPVHELSVDQQGNPYFTMPLIRGRDFSEIIRLVHEKRDGWTLARALGIVLKVCEALAYAHARGVIHRDIKPSNVRVGRFGETYVMDWGLARVLGREDTRDIRLRDAAISRSSAVRTERSRLKFETPDSPLVTMDGEVVGTPFYMSPEQARGETENLGARSDVYSVGALFYHLLSGRAPYAPKSGTLSARAVWGLVLDGPPTDVLELMPNADHDLVAICRKAMARAVEARYAGVRDMAEDIEAWIDSRPVRANPPTLLHSLRLSFARHRGVAFTILVAIIGLAALGAWSVLRIQDESRQRESARRASQRRADLMGSQVLIETERDLWPATPAMITPLKVWLDQVADLHSRRADYASIARINVPGDASEHAEATATLRHVDELMALDKAVGVRHSFARGLERITLIEPATAWAEACADIGSLPTYGGLRITPQLGLVPLGKNARSGLWEFWAVVTGPRPSQDEKRGGFRVAGDQGIVLVLVPAGSLSFPSRSPEPGQSDFESSLRTVSAFFVSKFEITQGQWVAAMGSNIARLRHGTCDCPDDTHGFGPSHPLESSNWFDCEQFCRRVALRMPTEVEWEYAARAGSSKTYGCEDHWACLEGSENLFDQSFRLLGGDKVPWNDGFPCSAPVGSFAPNPFGIYDVGGNVSEWCSDEYIPPNGTPGELSVRIFRGGSWFLPVSVSGLWFQQRDNARGLNHARGARAARSVDA